MGKTLMVWFAVSIVLSIVHGQMCNSGCGCTQNQICPTSDCGCSQNQNVYLGTRNGFGQPVSPSCLGPLPCYDVVIHQLMDGPIRINVNTFNSEDFLEAPTRAGMMRQQVLTEGRKAAAYFRDTYAVDFTSLSDNAFLTGRRMNADGVEFRPYIFPSSTRYRMYMASTSGGSQLFNSPIYDQGWLMNFTRQTWGRGSFKKPIPARTFAVFGHFFIHPCGMASMENNFRPCTNILNPQDPWAPLVIHYRSPTYLQIVSEPYTHMTLDYIIEHPLWGEGRGRALVTARGTDELIVDGRMTLSFPSYK